MNCWFPVLMGQGVVRDALNRIGHGLGQLCIMRQSSSQYQHKCDSSKSCCLNLGLDCYLQPPSDQAKAEMPLQTLGYAADDPETQGL
jgi:hypothetical protein